MILKPSKGYSHFLHTILNILYVGVLVLFVRREFELLALGTVLLSKWRILAVSPRYWLAHIRVNFVDILVGLSSLAFMLGTTSIVTQGIWAGLYIVWLVLLKPRSDTTSVALQALVSQTLALCALLSYAPGLHVVFLTTLGWGISYAVASHFITAFEDEHVRLLSNLWALFVACLLWILSHWLIFFSAIPQAAIIITVVSYTFASIYWLGAKEKLTPSLKRQFVMVALAVLVVIIVFSDWQSARF